MADQEDPPGHHFPPIAPDDPEWFLYFTDPANGICHTVSCSEFTTAFGANITHHRRSLGHIIAACVDENLQKLNIAGTITYAELERKQSIHRSLTCHVCPELYGGGVTVEPTAYAAHITSHEHMILEQETDGYESIGLLSWQKCREPYCPGYGMGIPPWRLARHLHCDVHRNAGRMFSVLAETGMSPGQLAARAAALRKGICDIRGCLGYGAANRSREPADLLDHLESHWHRHAQRVRLGLPLESESDPERHYCRLMGCRGHAGNGGNVFRSRSSYSRHLNGHRHQEAVQGIKERVMAAVCHSMLHVQRSDMLII